MLGAHSRPVSHVHDSVTGGQCMDPIVHDRPEPAGITLADLLALIVGAAIASALPDRLWQRALQSGAIGVLLADYQALGRLLTQLVTRACLALIPVVLLRRARYGG